MAWNDAITESTDWTALAFVNQFVAARNEREDYLIYPYPGTNQCPLGQAGTEVGGDRYVGWEYDWENDLTVYIGIGAWIFGYWWFLNAVDPTINASEWVHTAETFFASINGHAGYTCTFPAEFADPEDTTYISPHYTEPQAIAEGDYARFVGWEWSPDKYKVYHREGGKWVLTANPLADQPSEITVYDEYGWIAGDFISTKIFTESRAVLNKQLKVATGWNPMATVPLTMVDCTTKFGNLSDEDSTWADAKAAEEADYDAAEPYSPTSAEAPTMWSRGDHYHGWGDVPQFRAHLHTTRSRLFLQGEASFTSELLITTFYARSTFPPEDTWDGNGLFSTKDVYQTITTHVGSNTDGLYSAYMGDTTARPVWCAEPGDDETLRRGFEVDDAAAVIDATDVFVYK